MRKNVSIEAIPAYRIEAFGHLFLSDINKPDLKSEPLRALFYIAYLSAGRISEVLALRTQDIEEDKNFMRFRLITLKNPHKFFRTVPVLKRENKAVERMTMFVRNYLKRLKARDMNDLWEDLAVGLKRSYLRTYVWKQFQKRLWELNIRVVEKVAGAKVVKEKRVKIYPHYLRHCRLTHLAEMGLSTEQIKLLAGWSNTKPAEIYIHLRPKMIEFAMQKLKEQKMVSR